MFSPANTSTAFDEGDYAEPDLYFRTAPSDILQGAVMANLLIKDGRQNVAILARQDAYGETLAEEIGKGLEAAGSKVVRDRVLRREGAVLRLPGRGDRGSGADAVVLIAFEETTSIVPQLIQAGAGPQDIPTYFVDGNTGELPGGRASKLTAPGHAQGHKGTIPGAETAADFKDRLLEVNPKLTDYSYSAESYDATVVSALAAIAADSDAGEAVAEQIVDVTRAAPSAPRSRSAPACSRRTRTSTTTASPDPSSSVRRVARRLPRSASTSTTLRTTLLRWSSSAATSRADHLHSAQQQGPRAKAPGPCCSCGWCRAAQPAPPGPGCRGRAR